MRLLKKNKIAFFVAFMVGVIYLAPYVYFIFSLGDRYKGIPFMPSANEAEYVFRIHDILDGDWWLGSPLYFEYKNQAPTMPPIGEYLYALPTLLFGVSLASVLIASKFLLPVLLFLLVYFLTRRLLVNPAGTSGVVGSIAGAILVTMGYDLVDYRLILHLLRGDSNVLQGFAFIWTRPVNPVIGGILLMAFLNLVLVLWEGAKHEKSLVVFAGLFLALMFGSYVFSWGIAMAVLVILITFSLLCKIYNTTKRFSWVLFLGVIFSIPQLVLIWIASKSPWYIESSFRHGLFLTHYPIFNKFLLFAFFVYVLLVFFPRLLHWKRRFVLESWHWFVLALLIAGFVVYTQQIVTGRTIWPFHFVQYTIPLGMIAIITLFHNEVRPRFKVVWNIMVSVCIISPLFFGVYALYKSYPRSAAYYANVQSYAPLIAWLDHNPGPCVVLVDYNNEIWHDLTAFIPAFSHCDIYSRDWSFSMMPFERSEYNYMVQLRLQGIEAREIENYLALHRDEATGYLFSNWKSLFGVNDFPDVFDNILSQRFKVFPEHYRQFMGQNLRTALRRYRLDYIVSVGPLKPKIGQELNNPKSVFDSNSLFIYKF